MRQKPAIRWIAQRFPARPGLSIDRRSNRRGASGAPDRGERTCCGVMLPRAGRRRAPMAGRSGAARDPLGATPRNGGAGASRLNSRVPSAVEGELWPPLGSLPNWPLADRSPAWRCDRFVPQGRRYPETRFGSRRGLPRGGAPLRRRPLTVAGTAGTRARDATDEENLSAESDQAAPEARLPGADEDPFGESRAEAEALEGAQAPGRLRRLQVAVGESTGGFRRSDRLLDARDFRRVAKTGRRFAGDAFVMLVAPSGPGAMPDAKRLGISASRRVGNAVVRNRVKRGVREWFRGHRTMLPPGVDLVVIARRPAAELDATAIASSLDALARRATRDAATGSAGR